MKKFLAFILALACALSLMACGKKNNDDKPDPDPAPNPQPTVTTAEFTHGYEAGAAGGLELGAGVRQRHR